jgi:Ca2+-transporting ATPase
VIEALLTAIAIAVAAIPEGLPAIVAVVLSVGVLSLAKKKTIVRTLKAVETLGAVRYLLTDKTGTLTWNKINVVGVCDSSRREYRIEGEGYQTKGSLKDLSGKVLSKTLSENMQLLIRAGVLCNSAELEFVNGEVKVIGDTTEGALLVLAERLEEEYEKIRQNYQVITEEPFSSASKRMLVVVKSKNSKEHYLFAKGAPEVIFGLLKDKNLAAYREKIDQWASSGYRNLAFAWAKLTPQEAVQKTLPLSKLQFLGLVAEEDTVRQEAVSAVEKARRAGIDTIMITGDHRLAALSIAKQTGIASLAKQVINGDELTSIEDEMLIDLILAPKDPVRVFARVSPEQKLRIVNLIKERTGEVVAVTGDGVNDAPSIKAANVGVAMGKSGSDVAKEVADIVLADDNYATLVTGIFRGRVIFDNLIKFIRYLLSCNIGEVVVVFFGTLFGQLHILLPIQILFVNLVTDSLPALALGFEQGTPGILERSPRNPRERILNPKRWRGIIIEGVFIGALVLGAFYLFLPLGFSYARTVAFLVLVITQLFQALNSRDERETMLTVGLFSNWLLWGALILSFALTYLVTQTGYLSHVFETEQITNPLHWVGLLSLSSLVLGLSGVRKLLKLW